MARRSSSDVPTRSEVSERIEQTEDEFDEKNEEMETITEDIETELETEGLLDLGGSAEGAQEVLQSIEAAKDVTVDAFDQQDEQLETTQQDSKEHQNQLEGQAEIVEGDMETLSDAAGRIETQEGANEVKNAEEAATADKEFFIGEIKQSEADREKSEQIQQEQRSRAQGARA